MTKIDFYVMTGGDANDTLAVACRLTEKAFRTGTVYLHCVDKLQAATLQEKLWSFRPDAFIPHELSSERDPRESVVIGHKAPPESFHDILINLANETPSVFARFDRVLEIVPAEHSFRESSRNKWRYYKDRGYPLEKHDINP